MVFFGGFEEQKRAGRYLCFGWVIPQACTSDTDLCVVDEAGGEREQEHGVHGHVHAVQRQAHERLQSQSANLSALVPDLT